LILHIPHASLNTLSKEFLCDLDKELLRMSDRYTDELFYHPQATRIVAPISRLICDMERFEEDSLEEMASRGMGVCYTTNSFGAKLREVSHEEKEEILQTYYRPHHKALEEAVEKELQENGVALIIDCHSFSNSPLPHENDHHSVRPDICIGTDSYHTPPQLTQKIAMAFFNEGFLVKLNAPFAGTIVPMKFYRTNSNVHSIMIELNRDLYMEQNGEKKSDFAKIAQIVQTVLNQVL